MGRTSGTPSKPSDGLDGGCTPWVSSYAWRVKHNVAHHTYTNVDVYDADITQLPSARLAPAQEAPAPVVPPAALLHLGAVLRDGPPLADRRRYRRVQSGESIGTSALRMPRRWDLAGLIGGKVIFFSWAIVVPLLVYPWWAVLGAYLVYSMVVSLIMAVTFQLAHCVEEADFATAESSPPSGGSGRCTRSRRRSTSARATRFSAGSSEASTTRSSTTCSPGCRTLTTQIAKIVQRNAKRHGVRYVTHHSLRAALRSHFRHLRTMGRNGVPVTLEMG